MQAFLWNLAVFQGILCETTRELPGQAPAPAWDAGSLEYLGRCGSQEVAVSGDPTCTQEPFYADFHACLCFTGTEVDGICWDMLRWGDCQFTESGHL